MAEATWHYLQISDTLDREFASALSEFVPVLAWQPKMRLLPSLVRSDEEEEVETLAANPQLRVRRFPLQKGFSRVPDSLKPIVARGLLRRLHKQASNPAETPLVCSIPHFARVAENWPGPVIYYLTDFIAGYDSADSNLVKKLDRRMCRAATLVCVNSQRLADYLVSEAGCAPEKIEVIPNATRAASVLAAPRYEPAGLPEDANDLPRPIAGIIGNMAANLDWVMLSEIIEKSRDLSWLFIGPTTMPIRDDTQRQARQRLIDAGGRIRFIGRKPYDELPAYARGLDFGIIPYSDGKPTSFGSSTRLYDHLASCRPILTNRNVPVPAIVEPLVHFFNSADEACALIEALRRRNFDDGAGTARWVRSQTETWQHRAFAVFRALQNRLRQVAVQDTDPVTLFRLLDALRGPAVLQSR